MSKIGLIIKREYLSRVRKKTFILMSFLGPFIIVGFVALIAFLAKSGKNSYEIIVFDEAKIYQKYISNDNPDAFQLNYFLGDKGIEEAKLAFKSDTTSKLNQYDLFLYLPKNMYKTNGMRAKCFYKEVPSNTVQRFIDRKVNDISDRFRVDVADFDWNTFEKLKGKINVDIIDIENQSNKNIQRKGLIGFIFAGFVYFFIFTYSIQVMKGVIEEKTNRIVEIIISSVSSFELMIAKIIGIGLVGLTQFIISMGVIFIMSSTLLSSIFPDLYSASISSNNIGVSELNNDNTSEIIQFILYEINWPTMFLFFGIYFVGGYLLYGGLMAAIGAAVDEETDTQQFLLPITIPLLVSLIMIPQVVDNPSSTFAFWLSEIPFTSPVIMMVRIAMGIGDSGLEIWEVILSLFLLITTFIGTTWISSRIYRKGILSHGKKASYRDLFKWIKS